MTQPLRLHHPFQVAFRLLRLVLALALVALVHPFRVGLARSSMRRKARARWLGWSCRRVLAAAGVAVEASGPLPRRGLLVSNHMGYLDILALASQVEAVFVSKREVRNWPVFGALARMAGTLFVHRERRSDALRVAGEIQEALDAGSLVVLFPEGTSTGGNTVLPFKSALLGDLHAQSHPVTPACIRYTLADGDPSRHVAYWGDMTLLSHMLGLLDHRGVTAHLHFAPPLAPMPPDRKTLAVRLHRAVMGLHPDFAEPLAAGALPLSQPEEAPARA